MDRTERFYKIHQLLDDARAGELRAHARGAARCRAPRCKRDLEYMRDRLNAPIAWDRERSGYRFARERRSSGAQYELPGLWFNSQEIHALLTMQHLLANLDPGGLLAQHIKPLQPRLNTLLGAARTPVSEIGRRVLVVGTGKRPLKLAHFERVGSALLRRKRLQISYFARSTRRDHRARGLAAAPGALPRELVPGRLVPPAQ